VKLSRKRHRLYPLNQSPLFKLRGLGQFEKLLHIDLRRLPELLDESNYRVFLRGDRWIQQPLNALDLVHRRIAKLLSRVEKPDYLYSQRGRSHIDNASRHVGTIPLVKTDINKFHPSTTRDMVVRLFAQDFQCATDIANILGDICCYRAQHLPTGSSISGYIAFLAAKPMFDEIDSAAKEVSATMTLFGDDVTISGANVGLELLLRVRRLVRLHGLRTRKAKSKSYEATQPKPITGAVVRGYQLLLPNKQHKKIAQTRRDLRRASPLQRYILKARLKGQLLAAQQVSMQNSNL
jgi:hypothetical protein